MSWKNMLFMLTVLAISGGCVANTTLIGESSLSTRSDVFKEVGVGAPVPPGWSQLRVVASLKTHGVRGLPGKDWHGTPDYKLLVNVDGQALEVTGTLETEYHNVLDHDDPEAGAGARYRFVANLRLKPGTHRVAVALPFDGVVAREEVTLADREQGALAVKPVYSSASVRRRPGFSAFPTFQDGIKALRLSVSQTQSPT